MSAVKNIASIIPISMSVGLIGENLKQLNKKKTTSKDMVKLGVTNVVGLSLIGASNSLIGDL